MKFDKSPETIAKMFNSVASRYDFMNDLMTFFSHRYTRKLAVRMSGFGSGQRALDLATGTGDFAFLLDQAAGGKAEVTGVDISKLMLMYGAERARRLGVEERVNFLHGDIHNLPFEEGRFDVCTIGYGIRNVPEPVKAMREIYRVTKPGGRFLVVEATPPLGRYMRFLSNFYFEQIVPFAAKLLSPNANAYKYFAQSVNNFPVAPKFAENMREAGWSKVHYYPLFLGTVTVFIGFKA